MTDSILNSVKKVLGLDPGYTPFDVDIVMHINTVFSTLAQLGVGPATGFMIEDELVTWADFLGQDLNMNNVKTYVCLKVRMSFDPPVTSFAINAMQEQIRELEWRISVNRELTQYRSPILRPISEETNPLRDPVIDGGVG